MAEYNLSQSNADIAVVIAFELDGKVESIVLDTVDDIRVQASSTVTEHPIVSGEMSADHMFKEPTTMSITGMFQLLKKSTISTLVNESLGSHLSNIEALFERLKNDGILCEIVKISVSENRQPRFMRRSSMVLVNIGWTEKVNTLGFNFQFREVIQADVIELEVDTDDAWLPNPNDPKELSFTNEIMDWEEVDKALITALLDAELITEEFLQGISALGATAVTSILVGAAGGVIAGAIAAKLGVTIVTVCGVSGPVGWIVGAAIAIVAFVVGIVSMAVKAAKKAQYTVKEFKTYKDEEKMAKEQGRFIEFVGQVHLQFEQLNDVISAYNIAANEEQQCILSIGDSVYSFVFGKNNTSGVYSLTVLDIDDNVVKEIPNAMSAALDDFSNCKSSNAILTTANNRQYVYLLRTGEDETDLTSYNILVSDINLDNFSQLVEEILQNALIG